MDDELPRYGGAMGEGEGEAEGGGISDAQKKKEEMERRKAEVRKRLEESGKAGKKAKKGFLTPERKKKLRKLLMVKAAEELKNQQLMKDQERQKVLAQRIIPLPDIDNQNDQGALIKIYEQLWEHVVQLEESKFDINQIVLSKEREINELTIAVNDLRGKFVKPPLKKVSKYDNKFKRMGEQKEGTEHANFRTNLKTVKKENAIDEIMAKKKTNEKPEWKKKAAGEDGEADKEEKSTAEPSKKEEAPAPAEEEAPPAENGDAVEEGGEEEEEEEE